jgi:hypothetical protein
MCAIGMLCISHTIELGVNYKTTLKFPKITTPAFAHPNTRIPSRFKNATLCCRPTR